MSLDVASVAELLKKSERTHISEEFLRRTFQCSFGESRTVMKKLVEEGIVGAREGAGHPVLATRPAVQVLVEAGQVGNAVAPGADEQAIPNAVNDTAAAGHVAPAEFEELPIAKLAAASGVQLRAGLNQETVENYACLMSNGVEFPPITVFLGDTGAWVLADGHHRLAAAKRVGKASLPGRIRRGSMREATLAALEANASHGLGLTSEEKRTAVRRLLDDPEWGAWSDREIARKTGTSAMTVGRLRRSRIDCNNVTDGVIERRKCRVGGRERSVRVGRISKRGGSAKSATNGAGGKQEVLRLVERLTNLLSTPDRGSELTSLVSPERRLLRQLAEALLGVTGSPQMAAA